MTTKEHPKNVLLALKIVRGIAIFDTGHPAMASLMIRPSVIKPFWRGCIHAMVRVMDPYILYRVCDALLTLISILMLSDLSTLQELQLETP